MKIFNNSSFLYSDRVRVSNHKARYKKQSKRIFYANKQKRLTRLRLLFAWNTNNVPIWGSAIVDYNSQRLNRIKTIKRTCLYSNRMRNIKPYLGISKYKIADFSRRGLIKDLKKF